MADPTGLDFLVHKTDWKQHRIDDAPVPEIAVPVVGLSGVGFLVLNTATSIAWSGFSDWRVTRADGVTVAPTSVAASAKFVPSASAACNWSTLPLTMLRAFSVRTAPWISSRTSSMVCRVAS